jgi:hypothetical protein
MNLGQRGKATFFVATSLFLGCGVWTLGDDAEPTHQLSLADLAAYRTALTGKATADDAKSSDSPARVSFKDLWNRPDAFRGRRVTIEGRVQRIFRQGPVGSFPALAEIWVASPVGDPFCLVVPKESDTGIPPVNDRGPEGGGATSPRISMLGQTVRFTGTFLKMISYAAGDGDRLAPLVVGDQPPFPVQEAVKAIGAGSASADSIVGQSVRSPVNWLLGLTLALLAAGSLAWRHLRLPPRRRGLRDHRRRTTAVMAADPPLEFIEPSESLD